MKAKTKASKAKKPALRVGVLGYGEVGQAIASFYKKPYIQDLSRDEFPLTGDGDSLDVLHVCIPFSADFIEDVSNMVKEYCAKGLTIIHSTVPVGTTQRVAERLEAGANICHSPVRGVHPNLAVGVKTFTKYIGADHPSVGIAAMEHLKSVGIPALLVRNSKTTELAKLLDTTYYGLCIAFTAYANELCEKENLAFDRVMTDPNASYNAGYTKLGKKNVVRPVLFAPPDGRIGGHCVIPNAELLTEQYGEDALLQAILRHK